MDGAEVWMTLIGNPLLIKRLKEEIISEMRSSSAISTSNTKALPSNLTTTLFASFITRFLPHNGFFAPASDLVSARNGLLTNPIIKARSGGIPYPAIS
jgi:hypothetical protein